MQEICTILIKIVDQFPWIALVLVLYYMIKLTERFCIMSKDVEIENIRNQHQKEMFDKNSQRDMDLLKLKNDHEIKKLEFANEPITKSNKLLNK